MQQTVCMAHSSPHSSLITLHCFLRRISVRPDWDPHPSSLWMPLTPPLHETRERYVFVDYSGENKLLHENIELFSFKQQQNPMINVDVPNHTRQKLSFVLKVIQNFNRRNMAFVLKLDRYEEGRWWPCLCVRQSSGAREESVCVVCVCVS